MTDHKNPVVAGGRSNRTVGVRELKTHAAQIVRQVREAHASYIVTHRGQPVGVILPVDPADPGTAIRDDDDEIAWSSFLQAGRRLQRRFRTGVSGVALLSAQRR